MKIKVCGMKFPENMTQVAALRPDYLGFIFFNKSPRNFDDQIPEFSSEIIKTGVFVNSPQEFISEKVKQHNFRAIQLHGEESPAFCAELKEKFPKAELIKVFSIKDKFNFAELQPYEGIVDFFLFDTKGKNKGGNGYSFDWEILMNYPSSTPFFLSGGIGFEESSKVEEFLGHLEASGKRELLYAVDVNSRFEVEPGLKNVEELKKFRSRFKQ